MYEMSDGKQFKLSGFGKPIQGTTPPAPELPSVQAIRRKAELAKWYLDEAYRVHDANPKNTIGITFWLLMEQETLRE